MGQDMPFGATSETQPEGVQLFVRHAVLGPHVLVPLQTPPMHWSLFVQLSPSSHGVAFGAVPQKQASAFSSQAATLQGEGAVPRMLAQSRDWPLQTPPVQVSLTVHHAPSLQGPETLTVVHFRLRQIAD